MKNIDTNEILKRLCGYNTKQVDTVPDDWKTIEDLSKVWNLSIRAASTKATELYQCGVFEVKKFMIPTGITKKVIKVNHYRVNDPHGCLAELKKPKHRQK